MSIFHKSSPIRIFAVSALASVGALVAVGLGLGADALFVTVVLAAIEITFSFDNAIINAKVLEKLAKPWQLLFLTVGIVIAIFGMRVLFPIVIVALTAHLGWHDVVNLALHHPHEYAHHLEKAHASIAAFGGAFLLMLSLNFFFDDERKVRWIRRLENWLSRFSHWSVAPLVAVVALITLARLPANSHGADTLVAGLLGAGTYVLLQVVEALFARLRGEQSSTVKQTGVAALLTLLYLEILDASFSFDGVIGAFAVTSDVVLIAIGLGIGALWARSLTVYMVRRRMLSKYIYVEHGAHYTVFVLAVVLLLSVMYDIADYIPGVAGLAIIGSSVAASLQAKRSTARHATK